MEQVKVADCHTKTFVIASKRKQSLDKRAVHSVIRLVHSQWGYFVQRY